ncbi:MAG: O-antigen ligase family protein [Actinomycetota bacterium]|nr:O-antigen ligase family protein [Actinomycetota bacterium]
MASLVSTDRLVVGATAVTVALLPLQEGVLPGNVAPVDPFIVVAFVVMLLWAGWTRPRLHLPYALPVGMLVATGTLAALLGSYPLTGGLAVSQDLFLLAWGVVIANVAARPEGLSTVLRVWAYSAVAWALVLAAVFSLHLWTLAGVDLTQGTRAALTFGDQNTAALYFALSLAVVLAAKRPRRPVARFVAVVLILYALVLTGSLSGFLGLAVALAVAAFVSIRRRHGMAAAMMAITLLTAAAGGAFMVATSDQLAQRASGSQNSLIKDSIGRGHQSSSEREVLASETTALYFQSHLVGLGANATYDTLVAEQASYTPHGTHNDFIAAIVERGVLGEIALLVLVGAIAVRSIALGGRALPGVAGREVPAPGYLLGAVVSLVVFTATHEILHDRNVWTLLGLVAALYLWIRNSGEADGHRAEAVSP